MFEACIQAFSHVAWSRNWSYFGNSSLCPSCVCWCLPLFISSNFALLLCAFLFVSWSLRLRWCSSDCLSRISWRGLLYFSAPVVRWIYKLGTHKKHEGMGHILGVTKDKQKRGRTCVPLLYFKSLVVGLFFAPFESDVCLCLFPCATTRLIVFFLSVWQDISLSPR